jgi:hypothetical protein
MPIHFDNTDSESVPIAIGHAIQRLEVKSQAALAKKLGVVKGRVTDVKRTGKWPEGWSEKIDQLIAGEDQPEPTREEVPPVSNLDVEVKTWPRYQCMPGMTPKDMGSLCALPSKSTACSSRSSLTRRATSSTGTTATLLAYRLA